MIRKICILLISAILIQNIFSLERPKSKYKDFILNNEEYLVDILIDINSINGTFWIQDDDKHICYEDKCLVSGILIFSGKLLIMTYSFDYQDNTLKLEHIDAAYSYQIHDKYLKTQMHDFTIQNNKLIDINKKHSYVLFQAFPVNSEEQEEGNELWLQLMK